MKGKKFEIYQDGDAYGIRSIHDTEIKPWVATFPVDGIENDMGTALKDIYEFGQQHEDEIDINDRRVQRAVEILQRAKISDSVSATRALIDVVIEELWR